MRPSTQRLLLGNEIARWANTAEPLIPLHPAQGVDFRMLVGLHHFRLSRGSGPVDELVSVFLTSAWQKIHRIKNACASGDLEAMRRDAHSLKSGSTGLGAHALAFLASRIEDCEATISPEISQAVGALQSEYERVRKELQHRKVSGARATLPRERKTEAPSTQRLRILVIEDSATDEVLVRQALGEDYDLMTVGSGTEALKQLRRDRFSLLLLDVMLPDADGFALFQELRKSVDKGDLPVVFVTAKSAISDKLRAFSLGADDYVVKPFHPLELKARVSAILRRVERSNLGSETLRKGDILVELPRQKAYLETGGQSQELDLTPIEFKLLCSFIRSEERVLTREELLVSVWGKQVTVLGRTIDKHVCSLRQKLSNRAYYIATVPRVGYRFSIA